MFAFRVDANPEIGNGHVFRCLTLALALRQRDIDSCFIMKQHAGGRTKWLRQQGFDVFELSEHLSFDEDLQQTREAIRGSFEDIQCFVVDHYQLNQDWTSPLRAQGKGVLVIDDLCNRRHDCDFLLDQSLGRNATEYSPWLSSKTCVMAGIQYALLRKEFNDYRPKVKAKRELDEARSRSRILVSMGATDNLGYSASICRSILENFNVEGLEVVVVLASNSAHIVDMRKIAEEFPNISLKLDVDNMPQLMLDCQIAIGASGSSSWERCCMGLPTISIVTAENQRFVAQHMSELGASYVIEGLEKGIDSHHLIQYLKDLKNSDNSYRDMWQASYALCDGRGCDRVLDTILN